MDLSILLGSALMRLGSNIFAPAPPAPVPPMGSPTFEKSLSTAIDKSSPPGAIAPLEPHQWTEVQEVLRLLDGHKPVALEVDADGCLFVVCDDQTKHLIVLSPERGQELHQWLSDQALTTAVLPLPDFGTIQGIRQVTLQAQAPA